MSGEGVFSLSGGEEPVDPARFEGRGDKALRPKPHHPADENFVLFDLGFWSR